MKGRDDLNFRHPAERCALAFLELRGHRLLRHNYHTRFCEIDLITLGSENGIHFIEVKAWQAEDAAFKHPLQSLTRIKLATLRKACAEFMYEAQKEQLLLRFNPNLRIDDLPQCIDLIWVKSDADIELFENLY
ncbi:MAG: YraN family protein [Leptospiraceae bacterium]|nr:YraN family protein [Leptospiraceae bacterium]